MVTWKWPARAVSQASWAAFSVGPNPDCDCQNICFTILIHHHWKRSFVRKGTDHTSAAMGSGKHIPTDKVCTHTIQLVSFQGHWLSQCSSNHEADYSFGLFVFPFQQVNLKLILVSGKTKEFLFSPEDSAAEIAQFVFENWPEGTQAFFPSIVDISQTANSAFTSSQNI